MSRYILILVESNGPALDISDTVLRREKEDILTFLSGLENSAQL